MLNEFPVLYSFRRCPYAIRARLALLVSKQTVELREVLLRDKPEDFLNKSPSKTVPCLVLNDEIIDESLDIMLWALKINDPENWLEMPNNGFELIQLIDDEFKPLLDKTKYAVRFPNEDFKRNRADAIKILREIDESISKNSTFKNHLTLLDMAIFPFIRQFAFIDLNFFNNLNWKNLIDWLNLILNSKLFSQCQKKFNQWSPSDKPSYF
tara:strand:- start:1042 stop:1671 length:630 start_codon:yes stop_codon:yes gene_type:complete